MVEFNIYHPEEDNEKLIDSIYQEYKSWVSENANTNIHHPLSDNTDDAFITVTHKGEIISIIVFTIIGESKESWWRSTGEVHNGYKTSLESSEVENIESEIINFIKKLGEDLNISYFIYHASDKINELLKNNKKYTKVVKNNSNKFIIPCKEYGYEFRGFSQWSNPTKLESEIVEQTGESANVTELREQTVIEIPYNSDSLLKFVSVSDESTQLTSTVTDILKSKDYTDIEWNLMDEGSLLKKTREGEPDPTKEVIDAAIAERLK